MMNLLLLRLSFVINLLKISRFARYILFFITIFTTFETAFILGRYKFDKDKYDSLVKDCYAIKTYIINTNSKRIHVNTCGTADRMNERNRKNIKDSIMNLVKEGYVICGNCGAGIKSRNLINEDGTLTNVDFKTYDVGKLPTYNDYLKNVDLIGNWYVSHIPTYRAKLSTELLEDEFSQGTFIKDYSIGINKYYVVSNDKKDVTFKSDKNLKILRANEKAVINYINNKSNIVYRPLWIKRETAYYPCEYLEESTDNYTRAGDDCVRYFFTIMNSIKPDFTFHLENMISSSWDNIQAKDLCNNYKEIPDAMYKLGFEVYDSRPLNRDIDNDGVIDYQIKNIDSNFSLRNGDIILRPGHLHIYSGTGSNPTKNFGWGRVYRNYPRYYSFNNNTGENSNSIVISEENNINLKYTRIYRYIGVAR